MVERLLFLLELSIKIVTTTNNKPSMYRARNLGEKK
jgi:hypothetical protein